MKVNFVKALKVELVETEKSYIESSVIALPGIDSAMGALSQEDFLKAKTFKSNVYKNVKSVMFSRYEPDHRIKEYEGKGFELSHRDDIKGERVYTKVDAYAFGPEVPAFIIETFESSELLRKENDLLKRTCESLMRDVKQEEAKSEELFSRCNGLSQDVMQLRGKIWNSSIWSRIKYVFTKEL